MGDIIKIDFQGDAISFDERGWFNATVAAKRFGKRPADWLRLPEVKRYIAALANRNEVRKSHFIRATRGGDGTRGGGATWLHPKLAVRFAQWLDVDFAVWCDEQIDTILRSGIAPAPSIYEQIIALQVEDKTTKAKASVGGKWMNERKVALRSISPKMRVLEDLFQPRLPLSA